MKKNLILDLDQTIISAESYSKEFKSPTDEEKEKQNKYIRHNMDDLYVVFERPHLQEFLDYIFEKFNVSVWTAATKDYGIFIIENIIKHGKENRQIQYFMHSSHCSISKKKTGNTKDLTMLWEHWDCKIFNKDNTVIIDDYDEVFNTQKKNCIRAPEFKYSEDDSHNCDFLKNLKEILNKTPKEINKKLYRADE